LDLGGLGEPAVDLDLDHADGHDDAESTGDVREGALPQPAPRGAP
jgi:hypothetical protein